jgi:hypothetical protein
MRRTNVDFLVVAPVAQVGDIAMKLSGGAGFVEILFGLNNGALGNGQLHGRSGKFQFC